LNRTRWPWLVAGAALALVALSFVQGWIVEDRELRGEGYRSLQIQLSAWRGVAVPVTSAAAVAALAVAFWASVRALVSPTAGAAILVIGSALVAGLITASAWPVTQAGHASTVRLSAGPLWPIALALALLMLGASLVVTRPSRRVLASAAAIGVLALAGGAGGRWIGLQLAEGTGRHWEVGSYTRQATDGQPTETMTLDGTTYVIGDRWSGSLESSGWTVVLADDPACPGARGTYHAHGVDDADLRFVKVVDTCLDGARAEDLQAGTWARDP
jgi:hypothetical protein